jgi:CO dehydrogenase maturation factor
MLKSLITYLLVGRSEVVIVDMDAGVEHLGRGTAQAVDAFIVVVEPGQRSFQTAQLVKELAQDLGVRRVWAVGSKTKNEADRQFIRQGLPDFEVLGFINYHPEIAEADIQGKSAFDLAPQAVEEVRQIKDRLEQLGAGGEKG